MSLPDWPWVMHWNRSALRAAGHAVGGGSQVKRESLNGTTLLVKDGLVEHLGDSHFDYGGTAYSHLTFADGETLSGVVVESRLGRFVAPGLCGRFVFVRKGRGHALIGVEVQGIGLRTADPAFWRRPARAYAILGTTALIFGVPLSLLVIGLPLLFVAMPVFFYSAWRLSRIAEAARRLARRGDIPGDAPVLTLDRPLAKAA